MSFRILAVGDMHLGRRPRRLPESLAEHGLDARALSPTAAWRATVEAALERKVDVVLLAGDVVESLEDRFEAYGHLERGVARLVEAGIHVCGVAGNHDVEALPRLAQRIRGFELLGAGGTWQVSDVERRGEHLRILGWSFPERHHSENPLLSLPQLARDGVCTLGLLHCDLDAARSQYAPVSRAALESTACNAWLLGHIHSPSQLASPRPIGYLGSLAGLDPGEAGARGPWLLEAHADGRVDVVEQLPLSPIRWERVEVSCDGWEDEEERALEDRLEAAIYHALERAHASMHARLGAARVVAVRLVFRGATNSRIALRKLLLRTRFGELIRDFDGVWFYGEKLVDELAPAVDLEELARGSDPPALLARTLLSVRSNGQAAADICSRMEREVDLLEATSAVWAELDESPEALRERVLRCGLRALSEMLEQQSKTSFA